VYAGETPGEKKWNGNKVVIDVHRIVNFSIQQGQNFAFDQATFTSAFTPSLATLTIKALPTGATLKLNGVPVSVNQTIGVNNLGNLTYQAAGDFSGDEFTATALFNAGTAPDGNNTASVKIRLLVL